MFGSLKKKDLFKLIGVFYLSLSEVCAVNPKPTSATWVNAATTTIASLIGKVVGNEQANSDTEDWSSFQDFIGNARQAVSEVLDGIIPDEEILENLRNSLPDVTSFGLDLQSAAEKFKDWDWDKFAEEMLPSASSNEVEDDTEFDTNPLGIPSECSMTSPEIIKYSGYPCEVHHTETNDGYILELHRIPFGRSGSRQRRFNGKKRPVVFFQHGLLADSACWISNGVDKSLPFLLADAGCDVWLGNVRGNSYSRKHKKLNPDTDEKYWRFSWQQMSQSDLPAMVNKALRESGQSSLYYVGHSQGTLIAFARLAEDSLFNDKIRLFFALGPVTTVANITSPVRSMASLAKPAQFGMQLFGGAEILPKKAIYQWISSKMHALHKTSNDSLLYHGSNMMMYLCGVHPNRYHHDRLPIYSSHTPSGTSIQNLVHFGQMVRSGRMKKWDFMSEAENMDAYGQPDSPEYDLTRIRTQVALYVGSDDQLADPVDNKALSKKLKNLVHYEVLKDWDHLDFLWGQEAVDSVYVDILNLLISDHSTPVTSSRFDEL